MTPRVFGVDYQFLSCGDVFTQGLVHAAESLGVTYQHALWSDNNLPRLVKDFTPDVLFVVHGRRFTGRWKNQFVAPMGMAVWLLDEPYEVDETAQWSKRFDYVFINDAATLNRHPNATYLPVCYDPVLYRPRQPFGEWTSGPSTMKPIDFAVGFIGGGNQTRETYLSALAKHGLLTYVIGGPWDSPDIQRVCRSGNIPASQTVSWYQQTRIVINVFRERHHFNKQNIPATALNPRVYEATACGALVISEWRPEVETLVPELPTFRTVDECLALVDKFLADPGLAASVQAQCAARLAPHTYAARLESVLATCGLIIPERQPDMVMK